MYSKALALDLVFFSAAALVVRWRQQARGRARLVLNSMVLCRTDCLSRGYLLHGVAGRKLLDLLALDVDEDGDVLQQ